MDQQAQIPIDEPLWSAPRSITKRRASSQRSSEATTFLLCGLYCALVIFFLVFFGIAALLRQEHSFAYVILGFAGATLLSYCCIWISGHLFLAKHFVVMLMGTLCLYLFITGGTEGTGPIYYLGFPSLAFFLQGSKQGTLSSLSLLCLTFIIYSANLFNFDPNQYSFVFISRILMMFCLISMLAFLFAYFRQSAETESLIHSEDIERASPTDPLTDLASRNFMEKLLAAESRRYSRYQSIFCIMMLNLDSLIELKRGHGQAFSESILEDIAVIIRSNLRTEDLPSRWDEEEFLMLLPETTNESAQIVAERLLDDIQAYFLTHFENEATVTASIGIYQVNEDDIIETIKQADHNLFQAIKSPGSGIVNSSTVNNVSKKSR